MQRRTPNPSRQPGTDHASSLDPTRRSALDRWRAARHDRREQPFPSLARRVRSAIGLVITVVVLGFALAATVLALLVATLLIGSHLVGS